jgi:hypothetical protein
MALLDIFGDTPSYYGGLLGEEELRKAQSYAQQQGLQNAAMALLQAGAPSRTPGGGALAIAQGLQMGQNAYRDAMGETLKGRLTQMQLEDMMQKRAEEKALREQQARAQQVIQSGYRPEMGMIGNTPSQVLRDEEGNMMPGANIRPAGLDLQSVMPALRAMGPAGTKALTEQLGIEKTLADLAKSQRTEGFTLSEGQKRFEVGSDGRIVEVAGVAKEKPIQYQDLGNVVIGLQDGKEVARLVKGRPPEGPASLQLAETEQGMVVFNPRTSQITPVMQDGKPVMGKGAGQLTEGQSNAVTYGMRMKQADDILKPIENAGLKDTGKIRAGVSGVLGATPFIGEALSRGSDNIFNTLPTILGGLNEDQQKTIQARVNFITAVLRKESGASISPTEFATAEKNYFPGPGDPESIVKQKQQARESAIRGMKISAGRGAKLIDQEESPQITNDLARQAAAILEQRMKGR